jgi:hypothetical protein
VIEKERRLSKAVRSRRGKVGLSLSGPAARAGCRRRKEGLPLTAGRLFLPCGEVRQAEHQPPKG